MPADDGAIARPAGGASRAGGRPARRCPTTTTAGGQRAGGPVGEAALPHPDAVGEVVEEAGGGVAGGRHRRPPLPPVEDRRHDQGRRQRQPQPGDDGGGGQGQRPPGARDRAAERPPGREGPAARQPAGQRPGVIGERAEAPGEQRRRGPGDRGAGSRPPRRRRGPGQRAPSGHRARRHRARMAQFQRRRRRAVVAAPAQPVTKPHPVLVADGRPGLIPDVPAGRRQPPDEVNVFPDRHVLREPAARGGPADQQRRARHVRHPRPRPDDALHRPHVEGRRGRLVPRQPAAALLMSPDPGRHGSHRGIGEVPQQRRQPARPGDAVGIDEGDQRRAHGGEAGVPGGARSSAPVAAQAERTGRGGGRRHGGAVRRPVVHHDDPHAVQAGQAPGQLGRAVAHRDDGRDLVRPGPPAGSGWASPASSRRRASSCAAGRPGTGTPSHHPRASAAPRGLRRSRRSGAPPTRTVPPARLSRPGSGRRRIPAGTGERPGRGTRSSPAGSECPGRGVALAGTVWKHISSDHAAVAWRPGRRHGRRPS